jgi:hypothetical protein
MSTIDRTPLGGFEERLLTQLKAHVSIQPGLALKPGMQSVTRGRLPRLPRASSVLTAAAAAVAMLVAVLNLLPGGQTALAQAFPILTQRPAQLPAALERILRSQRLPNSSQPSDRERAYAFQAPTGTGYVVVDQQEKWICLFVPGLGTGSGNILCEAAFRLLSEKPRGLKLSGEHHGSEEIVELLPKGSTATLISTQSARPVALHHGVLTVVTHRPVSITTTINGRTTSTTYGIAKRQNGDS